MRLRINFNSILTALILIFSFSNAASAQNERQVMPVDEAKNDASFLAFRERFIAAVKKKDAKFLLGTLDSDIKGSFGGDQGVQDFKKLWKLDRPNTSQVWNELLKVLNNGGTFSKESDVKEFCAPYSFTLFPADLDAFEHQMIFGNNVNLREKPDLKSTVVAQLSYNVVKVDYENSIKKPNSEREVLWYKVETLGGKKGFVSADFVRSPIDYRACFEKKGSAWKMTFFLAGD